MPIRACGRLLVLACVLTLLCSGTASASDGLLDVDVAGESDDVEVALSADVDNQEVTVSSEGNDTGVNVSADDLEGNVAVDTDSSDADGTVAVESETNDTERTASLDSSADVDDSNTSVGAGATLDGTDATVTVGGAADGVALDVSVTGDPGVAGALDLITTDDDSKGEGSPVDEADGAAAGPTADESASTSDDGLGGSGGDPRVPTGPAPAAAVGVAIVAGTAATRRGLAAAGTGHTPLSLVYDALGWAVHWIRSHLPAVVPLRYSRRDDSDPLEHEVRADLYDAVQTAPGVYLSKLARDVDVSMSSVRHHVRVLEAESLVENDRIGGKRRYFPTDTANAELLAALDEPATASVLRALAAMESATVSALADRLGRDPSTITHHLTRLEDAGLVERERDGPAVVSRLTDAPRQVLVADDRSPEGGVAGSAD